VLAHLLLAESRWVPSWGQEIMVGFCCGWMIWDICKNMFTFYFNDTIWVVPFSKLLVTIFLICVKTTSSFWLKKSMISDDHK
jgi:hypothetical protein